MATAGGEARAAGAELGALVMAEHAAAVEASTMRAEGADGMRASLNEALRINLEMSTAASRASNISSGSPQMVLKDVIENSSQLLEIMRNCSALGGDALQALSRLDSFHRSVSDELNQQTSLWADNGAEAAGPAGGADSVVSELGAALERERNLLHGILSDGESEEQVRAERRRAIYSRFRDAADGAATVLTDVVGRFRRALAFSAHAAASGSIWGVGSGGGPVIQAEQLAAGLAEAKAAAAAADAAMKKGQDAMEQCSKILQETATPSLARYSAVVQAQTDAVDRAQKGLSAAVGDGGGEGKQGLGTSVGDDGSAAKAATEHASKAKEWLVGLGASTRAMLEKAIASAAAVWKDEAAAQEERSAGLSVAMSASIDRIATAVAAANSSACASAESGINGLNALAKRAAAASSSAAAAARGAGDSLLPLRNQMMTRKLPELRLETYSPRLVKAGPEDESIVDAYLAAANTAKSTDAELASVTGSGGSEAQLVDPSRKLSEQEATMTRGESDVTPESSPGKLPSRPGRAATGATKKSSRAAGGSQKAAHGGSTFSWRQALSQPMNEG